MASSWFVVVVAIVVNFSGGMTATSWLSSSPLSTLGGLDRVSAVMFVLPGMCLIS